MFTLDGLRILENGKVVATVADTADSDTGLRLVGTLNLAARDETLLDQIAGLAANRNLAADIA